jgi:hypothetical protein
MTADIVIERSTGCPSCGGVRARLLGPTPFANGQGHHADGMRCVDCGRHLGWLSHAASAAIREKNEGGPA